MNKNVKRCTYLEQLEVIMKELRCTTANCEHNKCEHCFANTIEISEKGVCKTKSKRDGGALSQLFENYEAGSSFDFNDVQTEVTCNADCIYNNNSECTREHLLVEDGIIRTKCANRVKDDYPRNAE